MAGVIYDEGADATLYRFLSFLRLLMLFHPRVGANQYALDMGVETDMVLGWNAVHHAPGAEVPVSYIFISPEGGRYTEEHPSVADEQMHVFAKRIFPRSKGRLPGAG